MSSGSTRSPIMAGDRPCVELFRQVTFTHFPGGRVEVDIAQCEEKPSPDEAEVCVPYHTPTAVYAITCYLTGIPNHQPAVYEAMTLMTMGAAMVAMTEET